MKSQQIIDKLFSIYQKYGHLEYGENCSVLSHSIQCGLMAKQEGCTDEIILATFLHDIGHIIPSESEGSLFIDEIWGVENHELIGYTYLSNAGFKESVIAPIKNHVLAKRYLCSKDPKYFDNLSLASKKTLYYQGGALTIEEATLFEKDPFFKDSIALRLIDDKGKLSNFDMNEEYWQYFKILIATIL